MAAALLPLGVAIGMGLQSVFQESWGQSSEARLGTELGDAKVNTQKYSVPHPLDRPAGLPRESLLFIAIADREAFAVL
jgi:hypothetical protein